MVNSVCYWVYVYFFLELKDVAEWSTLGPLVLNLGLYIYAIE